MMLTLILKFVIISRDALTEVSSQESASSPAAYLFYNPKWMQS